MQLPIAEDFEKALLISVIADPLLLPKLATIVEEEDFYKNTHRKIWRAINSLEIDNIDSLSVQDRLDDETREYLRELIKDQDRILPTIANAVYYAEQVRDKSKLREGIRVAQEMIGVCYQQPDAEEALQEIEDIFASFLQKRVLDGDAQSTKASFAKFLDSLRTRKPDDPNVIRTGYQDVDLLLQRMEGLILLAARTSLGKTAFAINIAMNVAKTGKHVLFFSLEQREEEIFERMLAIESGVPLDELRLGAFMADPDNKGRIELAQERLEHLMEYIHIDDKPNIPSTYVSSVARQKHLEWGEIGLIVVDYIHIMSLPSKQLVEALGDGVKALRGLGKEMHTPMLVLAQLNRSPDSEERKKNRRPQLSDLRSSGELEQSADSVLFLYRDSYYDTPGLVNDQDITEVIVAKNRNGSPGIVELSWYPRIVKFANLDRHRTAVAK